MDVLLSRKCYAAQQVHKPPKIKFLSLATFEKEIELSEMCRQYLNLYLLLVMV